MNVLKWLNEHFEEAIMVFLLAAISCVMMAQIIARSFFASMPWPEEFSRYCYIWTVFLSLGYTIRKKNMLKVAILMDLLPKTAKSIEIIVNFIMLAIFAILFRYSIIYTGKVKVSGRFHRPCICQCGLCICLQLSVLLAVIRMLQEMSLT